MASRHKYNAVPTTVDGIRFPSRREARRYGQLKLLVSAGLIRDLSLQPEYPLVVNGEPVGKYVADFRYWDVGKKCLVVEDAKGVRTPVYRLKKKLVHALYGFEVQEV